MRVQPPIDAAERTRRRYTSASTLGDVLSVLLDQIADSTPFERAVAVAGFDRDLLGVGRGVPHHEVEAFADALARQRAPSSMEAGIDMEESPLAALVSMRSPVLVPAVAPNDDFVAVVAVEAAHEHPALARVPEALRIAAPWVFSAAEIHGLRARVGSMESQRQRA